MSLASQTARPAGMGAPAEPDFDLPALGSALWRKKWKILVPTLVVALLTLGVVQLITPKYQSEARVLIESHDNVFLRPDADKDIYGRNLVDDETVTSQVQLVLSRDLARDVIAKLNLDKLPEFDPTLKGISPITALLGRLGLIKDPYRMTREERVLEAYYDRLTAYAVEKSHVIVIDFLSQDPKLAATVANAIAEEYLVRQRAAKKDQAATAVRWLSGEIETMQKKVAEAEAKVAAFRGDSNLLMGPNDTTLSAQQLGDFNAQLAAARAQKADAEAKAKIIRDMLRSGRPIESSDILNSELIRRLSEQRVTLRAQLAEQSASLGSQHPRIKELKAQIADLDHQIREEAAGVARSFENDAKIASARVDSLIANFNQIKNQAAATNERNVELRALERDAKAQRDLLESYLAKYREATARDTLGSSPADARVISRATESNVPAYPKKLPSVLIAAATTLMLGCGFVLTKELLSVPVSTAPRTAAAAPIEADAVASQPERASIAARAAVTERAPAVERVPAAEPVPAAERVVATERTEPLNGVAVPISAIADVAFSLRETAESGGVGRVAVLGTGSGLPTADAAISLARTLAEDARVILVGLESKNSAIAEISDTAMAAGLAELSVGTASFREIIGKDKLSSLHLITAGRSPIARLALLSSPRLATGFDALSRSYDYVVVDGGLAEGADLEVIGEIAPHAILLAETLSNAGTKAARERLMAAGFEDVTVMIGARATRARAAAAAA